MDAGPFDVKHLLIGAAIVIVTWVAMYMLKGLLAFGFVVAIWIFVGILVSVIVIFFVLILTITGYLRYGSEGFIFAKARKRGLFVYLDAELGTDNVDFVLGEKASPKDVVLKDEESGIKVDPSMLDSNAKPMRAKGGLDIYTYSYYNFMPQTMGNNAAFMAIEDYFKTQCKDLNFLSIKEFVELVSDPEHYLDRNAFIKLNKYFKLSEALDDTGKPILGPDGKMKMRYVRNYLGEDGVTWKEVDLDVPRMVQLIAKARADITRMPVMGCKLVGNEAFKYNSVAYSSQHLGHVLMLYYTKMLDEMKGKIDLLTYGIVGLMLLCGTGVAIYIISYAFGGK